MSALGSFLISWRGAFGPPGSKTTTVGLLFFPSPMLPHLRPTDGLRSRWNAGVFGAGLPSAFSLLPWTAGGGEELSRLCGGIEALSIPLIPYNLRCIIALTSSDRHHAITGHVQYCSRWKLAYSGCTRGRRGPMVVRYVKVTSYVIKWLHCEIWQLLKLPFHIFIQVHEQS